MGLNIYSNKSLDNGKRLLNEDDIIYQKTANFTGNYSCSNAWTWTKIGDSLTISKKGTYLCLFNGWIKTLGTEMDLAFYINNKWSAHAGTALGQSAIAINLISLNEGDSLEMRMQTDKAGSCNVYDTKIIIIRICD